MNCLRSEVFRDLERTLEMSVCIRDRDQNCLKSEMSRGV